ncbi:MAG TPA: glycosyltransferase family 39 protein [Ignavibacteria bacterium]|nr:glycosyltransferase family 39 protein [Ignavibacteria bacterium]HMR00013.1 glycosyltransferase family 39 protein [Ignavibacteria bacterium]
MTAKTEKILVFLVFTVCLSLRLAFISQKNLWFDEVFSWHLSLDSFYGIIVRTSNDIHPPLFYFTLKIWNFVFGDSVAAMRLLSALFTSSSVFFLYSLSKRYLDPSKAMLVILLYSVSPLNLYYGQEVRMAAMNLFLNLGSVYFLLKLMDKPHDYHRIFKEKYAIPFVLFSVAAIYTHYFSFFILAAELLYIVYSYRKNPKQYIAYLYLLFFIGLVYLVWVPELISHFSRGQSWRSPQTIGLVMHEYVNYIRDLNLGLYYYYSNLTVVRYITYFAALVILIAIIGLFLKKKSLNSNPILIMFVLFVTLFLAGVISLRQKIEFYRYLSILVPYISLFVVYGIAKWNNKYFTTAIVGLLIAVNIYGVTIHYKFGFKNDDYRSLITKINSEFKPGERIYVEPHFNGWVINYYKKQEKLSIPDPVYVRYGWNEVLDSISVQDPERFWVVFDYSAVDTSRYQSYIDGLRKMYKMNERTTYFLAPTKVELYNFSK